MTRGVVLGAVAIAALVTACGGGGSAPPGGAPSPGGASAQGAASSPSPPATTPAAPGPATQIVSYPVRIGAYRLVNSHDHPVTATTRDSKFPQSFTFAATARDGYYLPSQKDQVVYVIAGQLAPAVTPGSAIGDYLGQFEGQQVHLTTEPAGSLGGQVKCWESGGITFCMWADNGTYGVLDYRPPLGLDTALIHHLARAVPAFRQAMERAKS
jgi:hypothetical protein